MPVLPMPVSVLYGTELGNAEEISEIIQKELAAQGVDCVRDTLEAVEKGTVDLKADGILLVVCSTTGQGDPPDNALSFFKTLKKWEQEKQNLKFCRFAVLGLGDTNYDNFCQSGKRIDAMLTNLGASKFHELGCADDAVGLEEVVEPWKEAVIVKVVDMKKEESKRSASPAPAKASQDGDDIKMPKLSAPYLTLSWHEATADATEMSSSVDPATPVSRQNPFSAPITAFKRLSKDDKRVRETYTISMDISGCIEMMDYKAGDSFGVRCVNTPDEVEAILQRLKLGDTRHQGFTITSKGDKEVPKHVPSVCTADQFFKRVARLRGPLKKSALRRLAEDTSDPVQKRTLQLWSSKQGLDLYNKHVIEEGMWIIDLLNKFSTCQPSLETMIELLPALSPRYYSACSTPSDGNKLEFAFSVARFERTPPYSGGLMTGLFTGMLERMFVTETEPKESPVQLFPNRVNSRFHLPPDASASMIMIGPGTGVAPFIGFLREHAHRRAQAQDKAGTIGEARLYFGNRHRELDFLYQEELEAHVASGTLNKLCTCFSRDKDEKAEGAVEKPRYVQHGLKQDAKDIAELIFNGAYVFVCGDAKKMAVDVNETIINILADSGHVWDDKGGEATGPKSAADYVQQMKDSHRFVLDVWC